MTDRTSLPEYVIAFSHRATEGAEARCDRADYDTIYRLVNDLEKGKFKNKIRIKVLDWEEETSTIDKLNNAARKSNALIFLIEGNPGEKQLNGYNDYKTLEPKPNLLILDKQLSHWTEQDFKSHEELLKNCFEHKFIPFRDFDQLYGLLSRKLSKLIETWIESNSISLDADSTEPRRWHWLPFCAVIAVILIISLLLLLFGNRKSLNPTGTPIPFGDTTSAIAPIDSTHSPGMEKEPGIDASRSKQGQAGTIGSHEGKRAEEVGSSHENPDVVFENNAFAVLSEDNDPDIVFEIERQLKAAQLGLSFSNGGVPQWRIVIRESITDTLRSEYAGIVLYDPKVKLFASIFNYNIKDTLLHEESNARVYNDKEKAINAARDKAKEKLIAKIIDYFKNKL